MDSRSSASIKSDVPLMRAGLERLAIAARVDVVTSEGADFTLHSADQAPGETPIDVAIAQDVVVIACRRVPDPGTWDAVYRLVSSSLGHGSGFGGSRDRDPDTAPGL